MKTRRIWASVIGSAAFALNPFACSSGDSDADTYTFGETEMAAAIRGTWRLTFARPDGASSVTYALEPGTGPLPLEAVPGRTPQCGNRSFTKPAAACLTTSTLDVVGTVLEADPPLDTTRAKGSYRVFGLQYNGGQLDLNFGSALHVSADLDATNAIRQSYTDWQGARVTSLVERTPPLTK